MKKWNVRFKKIMDTRWSYCEMPFKSQESAEFFAATIQMTNPNMEAIAIEEKQNGES